MTQSPLRHEVVRRLHAAAADGRLTLDEADERLAAARTLPDEALGTLVSDLGPEHPAAAQVPEPEPAQFEPYPTDGGTYEAPVAAGYSPADPLVLSAGWEGVKRRGRWRVPPYLRVSAGIDRVRLDCLLAEHTSPVIDLEILPAAGSVVLVVPEGWGVQVDRLSSSFGSARSRVATDPMPGYPLVVVHGGVGLGSFKARHANRWERWRLRRRGIELPPPGAVRRELR